MTGGLRRGNLPVIANAGSTRIRIEYKLEPHRRWPRNYGEYANFYARDWMVDQVKIEVFAARDQVERIAGALLDAAHTGSPGDGIVVILPVETVLSARTRAKVIPNRLPG